MKRRIAIVVINVVVGLFALYMYACYVRETEIQSTQDNITCDIIELDLRHGYRHHPSAKIIYRGKEYYTGITINLTDSLSLGKTIPCFTMMGYLIESFAVIQVLKEVCIQALPFLFCLSCFGSIPKVIKRRRTLAEEASNETDI